MQDFSHVKYLRRVASLLGYAHADDLLSPKAAIGQFWSGDHSKDAVVLDYFGEEQRDDLLCLAENIPEDLPENIPENIPEPPDGCEGFWDDLPAKLKLEYQGLLRMARLPKSEFPLCFRLMIGRMCLEKKNGGEKHYFAVVCG